MCIVRECINKNKRSARSVSVREQYKYTIWQYAIRSACAERTSRENIPNRLASEWIYIYVYILMIIAGTAVHGPISFALSIISMVPVSHSRRHSNQYSNGSHYYYYLFLNEQKKNSSCLMFSRQTKKNKKNAKNTNTYTYEMNVPKARRMIAERMHWIKHLKAVAMVITFYIQLTTALDTFKKKYVNTETAMEQTFRFNLPTQTLYDLTKLTQCRGQCVCSRDFDLSSRVSYIVARFIQMHQIFYCYFHRSENEKTIKENPR